LIDLATRCFVTLDLPSLIVNQKSSMTELDFKAGRGQHVEREHAVVGVSAQASGNGNVPANIVEVFDLKHEVVIRIRDANTKITEL
jgi:hypothetical protein